jgi:hypothetical protein
VCRAQGWKDTINGEISPGVYLEKVTIIIHEVAGCPDGIAQAFHLFIYTKSDILRNWQMKGFPVPLNQDYEHIDQEVLGLVGNAKKAVMTKDHENACTHFDFARAKRHMVLSLPNGSRCASCPYPPPPPPNGGVFDPFGPPPGVFDIYTPPCHREPYLHLLQTVQIWAYSEILTGIMLTMSRKLPRELCLEIFEYTMMLEDVPMDPRVWEPDEWMMGMRIAGQLKEEFKCLRRRYGRRYSSDSSGTEV